MNIADTLDEMLRQLESVDALDAAHRQAVAEGNPFAKHAAEQRMEAVLKRLEYLVDTMDDSDWDDVKEGVQLFFDEEDSKANWQLLGLDPQQYTEAQDSGRKAVQAYLAPHMKVLEQKLQDMKDGDLP